MAARLLFTLVELLVVVAVIMLLMALLMPSLKSARDQAKRLVCANNLRNIGLYTDYYLSDYGGVFFPVGGAGGAGVILWRDYVEGCKLGISPTEFPSQKNYTCCNPKTMWWCPATAWIPGNYSGTAWPNSCKYGGNQELSYKSVGTVLQPSKTLLAIDTTLSGGNHGFKKSWSGSGLTWTAWIHSGMTANRVFIDGHTSTYRHNEFSSSSFGSMFWP